MGPANVPHLGWQTCCQPSRECSEARRPCLSVPLTTVSHGVHSGPCSAAGRTQEASPQALKAFRDFYPTVGLPDDMMVLLPKSGIGPSPAPAQPRPGAGPAHRAPPAARLPDPQSVQAGPPECAGGRRSESRRAAPLATHAYSPYFPQHTPREKFWGAGEGVFRPRPLGGCTGSQGPGWLGAAGSSRQSRPAQPLTDCPPSHRCVLLGAQGGTLTLLETRLLPSQVGDGVTAPSRYAGAAWSASAAFSSKNLAPPHPLLIVLLGLCASGLSLHITSSRKPPLIS